MGKVGSSPEFMTETLSRLKTDKEFRRGVFECCSGGHRSRKTFGASLNLLSAMVMAAHGATPCVCAFFGKFFAGI